MVQVDRPGDARQDDVTNFELRRIDWGDRELLPTAEVCAEHSARVVLNGSINE